MNLPELVKTNRAARYFRELINLFEYDTQQIDYHLKLRHHFKRHNQLDVMIYFGDPHRTSNPSPTSVCISCEPTHELSVASLLSERQYTRAWLDCRARAKLILTPIRHAERLSDLTDDDGEMEAFWRDAVELVDREAGHIENYYPTIVLNHGKYRNHAHLHLKISFTDDVWNRLIVPNHREKIHQIKQLLQKSDVVVDCLGQHYLKKTTHQKIPRINNASSNRDEKSEA
jgi:diadenosine tetraphosphate (Ap4A) HIT family hydrolase